MGLFDVFKRGDKSKEAPAQKPAETAKPAPPQQPAVTAAPTAETPPPPPTVEPPASEQEPAPKKGFFSRLAGGIRQGLQKTKELLKTDIRDLFKSEGRLVDDQFLTELKEILLRMDMGPKASNELVDEVQANYRARVVQMSEVIDSLKKKLKSLLAQDAAPIKYAPSGPTVIMVVGVNGSGKTTSIAKLTQLFTGQGKKVVLGAGDTFRAAAVEQLNIWAQRLGAEIVTGAAQSDPASVAHRAVSAAIAQQADVCIVDTAGRLQTQTNLMQELTKIHRVIGKLIPEAPHEVILVLDATSGQNGLSQAKGFTESVKCSGIVLAKIDGTAKGGVVVPIRQHFGLPVKYVGVGEKATDLELFQPDDFVDALFEGLVPEEGKPPA